MPDAEVDTAEFASPTPPSDSALRTCFTVTGGRTGTAWLTSFLQGNLGRPCLHEPLEISDFGETMPDIRVMRSFNTYGRNDDVRAFWRRKLDRVAQGHVETNHTLAKCGLIEALAESDLAASATVILLRRDIVKQCASYLARHDFGNVTLIWQWYLHPSYPLKLVAFEPFRQFGAAAMPLWYVHEMLARQEYYRRRYADRLNFIEVDLETVVRPEGARAFWNALGGEGDCVLPPPKNASGRKPDDRLVDQLESIRARLNFDACAIASDALKEGFSFDAGA